MSASFGGHRPPLPPNCTTTQAHAGVFALIFGRDGDSQGSPLQDNPPAQRLILVDFKAIYTPGKIARGIETGSCRKR